MGKRRRTSEAVIDIAVGAASAATDLDAPPAKKQQQRRSLFLRSLAPETTTEALIEHFSQSFPIKHATAVTDAGSKTCKGYGFITFTDAEDAKRALAEFNGSMLLGKKIKAEIAEPRSRDVDDTLPAELSRPEVRKAAAEEKKVKKEQERKEQFKSPKLIVRNLPWSIKKPEDLSKLFLSYGKVLSAVIPAKKPGLLSGFGFVVVRGKKNAEKALAGVNGKEIDGRTLAVDYAVDKAEWQKAQMPAGEDNANGIKVEGDDDSAVDEEEVMLANDEDSDIEDDAEESDVQSDGDLGLSDDEETERPKPDHSSTIFIRNLAYDATDETLKAHFLQFGPVRYARVVLDQMTERSRGTAFVCFFEVTDAQTCMRNAPRDFKLKGAQSSVLQSDSSDPTGQYTMDGRVLNLSWATDRGEAARLASGAKISREDKDKRRLYLLSEGTISARSPLYEKLSQSEVAMREASAKQRKALIQGNPSLHLSLTRLSVRNLPRSVTSKDLKALARDAVVGFASDVKAGRRQKLSKEELLRGRDEMVEAEALRKKSGKGIVKQAKVVFEGREGGKVNEETGAGRSRGYGFIEFHNHRSALMGLRWLNGRNMDYEVTEKSAGKGGKEDVKDRRKRLIVEFAIENAAVVKRRREKEDRSRGKVAPTKAEQRQTEPQPSLFDVPERNDGAAKSGQRKVVRKGQKVKPAQDDKVAQRARIIGKKRAIRKARKAA